MKNGVEDDGIEILIVEDSPTQAEELKYALKRHNFNVSVAGNGIEALSMIRERKPTMVISDIIMPEMDGYQLCREIKNDRHLQDLPVILLTSLSDPRDVVRGLECGADNFITKPYDEKYFHSRLQYIQANKHLREVEKAQFGMEVILAGEKYFIQSDRIQILNLLLSSYEAAIQKNGELIKARDELKEFNSRLEEKVRERTAALTEEIAERERAEVECLKLIDELEKRNAELERFTYTVSHDLKSPLVTILGFAGQLEQDLANDEPSNVKADLAFINSAANQMRELLDSLLHLSRAGRAIGEPRPADLPALVQQAIEQVGDRLASARLHVEIPPELPAVMGDPVRLREVFQNLLENAAKFTADQPEPHVEIGAAPGDGEVVCFVRDNGIGIPAEYQEKIFGLFEQLDPGSGGTGVGLAIVRRIVEEHGGRVWVESAGCSTGCRFWFTLPTSAKGE